MKRLKWSDGYSVGCSFSDAEIRAIRKYEARERKYRDAKLQLLVLVGAIFMYIVLGFLVNGCFTWWDKLEYKPQEENIGVISD